MLKYNYKLKIIIITLVNSTLSYYERQTKRLNSSEVAKISGHLIVVIFSFSY